MAPSGEIAAGPLLDKEGVLYFEMDLNEIVLEKMVHDFAGHYNRFDVFSLRVNNGASGKFHHRTLGSQDASASFDINRRLIEDGIVHLARNEAVPDELVKTELVAAQISINLLRPVAH